MGRALRLAGLAVAAFASLAIAAQAELTQDGDLRASFEGGISPSSLPRSTPAPVTVTVGGGVEALNEGRLPQLREIVVSINRSGELFDKGIPICKVDSIQPAEESVARRLCGDSIVGSGHVTLEVHLPSQEVFSVRGTLLAFNGPRRNGQKLILAQVYSKNPPGAFILTFTVKKAKGTYGTVISTTLPKYAENWAYLTSFELSLGRTYTYKGKKRAYVSASCAVPAGFTKALFPFAKAAYKFSDGQILKTKIARTCQVAGK